MSSDLFEFAEKNSQSGQFEKTDWKAALQSDLAPLAHRMRPQVLGDFVGQEKLMAQGKPLRRWIETDSVPSLILWGPPGCGKTTLAHIIAAYTHAQFESLSAVLSGIKEIKETVSRAQDTWRMSRRKTILFIDEIHRFNKAQQDALLPHVEQGTCTLIGATTENPSFELNGALLSRVRVLRLSPLDQNNLEVIIRKAIQNSKDIHNIPFELTEEAIQWISETSDGDARRALTALDAVFLYYLKREDVRPIDLKMTQIALESSLTRQPLRHDKKGEEHYNLISAFIKSIRDSDPDAGLYYLARMLAGGEDPLFIARRMVILASEDIGNADPRALTIALAAKEGVEFVGMPESRIILAQAVTYLAVAPKSNASYMGIEMALEEVEKSGSLPVPLHIRNGVTSLMKNEGYGKGYKYAHSDPHGKIDQEHLPAAIAGKQFYFPKDVGLERQIKEKLKKT